MSSCEQLDAFFDGELPAGEAAAFRDHLATCARCESALQGRMLEAMVVSSGSDQRAPQHFVDAPPSSRGRNRLLLGGVTALAAAAAIAWILRSAPSKTSREPGKSHDVVALAYSIERGPEALRGQAAHVGDTLHLHSHATVWVYRNDHELVLACTPDAPCDLHLTAIGSYSIVTLAGVAIRAPHGNLDDDVSGAVAAGADHRIETVEVQ